MPTIGPMIAASARLGVGYAQRLLQDVQPTQFARFAEVESTTIHSNHPAFICGHLSIYAPNIIEQLGGEVSELKPSATFLKLFSKDAECVDDPDGSIFPEMNVIVDALIHGYSQAADALEQAPDSLFHEVNPHEAMRAKFPTIGAMHAFYVGGHFMFHMGQFSAWRRTAGLGPA